MTRYTLLMLFATRRKIRMLQFVQLLRKMIWLHEFRFESGWADPLCRSFSSFLRHGSSFCCSRCFLYSNLGKGIASRAAASASARETNRGLEPLLQSLRSLRPFERFVAKDKKRIFFVPVSNVLWIEARGNYAHIHTAVTCCGKPWRTWRRSWRLTTSSACGSRPS